MTYGLLGRQLQDAQISAYDATETPAQALTAALAFWGNPGLTTDSSGVLTTFAQTCLPASMANWEQHQYRGLRQNALRQLVFSSPDLQTS